MSDFSKWYEQQTKDKGNDKLYRNKKGMELAWNAAAAEQREACRDKAFQYMDENTGVTWEVFIAGVQQAILNAVEKSDDTR